MNTFIRILCCSLCTQFIIHFQSELEENFKKMEYLIEIGKWNSEEKWNTSLPYIADVKFRKRNENRVD